MYFSNMGSAVEIFYYAKSSDRPNLITVKTLTNKINFILIILILGNKSNPELGYGELV